MTVVLFFLLFEYFQILQLQIVKHDMCAYCTKDKMSENS